LLVFDPLEIMIRAHLALGRSRDTWPISEPLKESPSPIQALSSSSSWKIKGMVSCKYPYFQAKSTFDSNDYSFRLIKTNVCLVNSNQDVQLQQPLRKQLR